MTCDSNGSCLSCNSSADFREINNFRCIPLPGYYESNVTAAGQCLANCMTCTSGSDCQACFPSAFFNSTVPSCTICPYSCYTCDSSGTCLSCNATRDFRYLNGSSCLPLPGYFESGSAVAGQCSSNCLSCTSSFNCL